MDAILIHESIYGSTRAVAEAIADGLGAIAVLPVHNLEPGIDTIATESFLVEDPEKLIATQR